MDDLEREDQLVQYARNLTDRFGPIPGEVAELMNAIRLRWKGRSLGFEKIVLKGGLLKGYLVSNPESPFYRSSVFSELIAYIQSHPQRIKLSEKNNKLSVSFNQVKSVGMANDLFSALGQFVNGEKAVG